nr:helitron helicase-like domain-containing protein [Tanacetum cinerariifolium]
TGDLPLECDKGGAAVLQITRPNAHIIDPYSLKTCDILAMGQCQRQKRKKGTATRQYEPKRIDNWQKDMLSYQWLTQHHVPQLSKGEANSLCSSDWDKAETTCDRRGNRRYLHHVTTQYLPEETISVPKSRIILRPPPEYPQYIKELYEDAHFIDNIHAYNQMFSMTSLGANIDKSINNGKGPYVFRISGQLYHWIGSLCPEEGQLPRTACDKHMDADAPEFKVRLYNVIRTRQYELPTSETIGAIVFGDSSTTENEFDLIIEEHSQFPQRYVVIAYCAIEQSILDYIRKKQDDIRSKYLSGSPRYMYSHYLDALAICRVHGSPSFFITFTCNTKWPEIEEFMKPFPQLTVADRVYIVDHVFEKKVQDYIAFVRNSRTFGTVTGAVHLENIQQLKFRSKDNLQSVVSNPMKKTTLTEWLEYNRRYTDGRHLTYLNFPSEYAWHAADRYWQQS